MIEAHISGDQLVVTLSGIDAIYFGKRRLSVPLARIYDAVAMPAPKNWEFVRGPNGRRPLDIGGACNFLHRRKRCVEVVLGGWDFTFLRMTVADPDATAAMIAAAAGHGEEVPPAP